jgi:hypothetical protein
MMREQLFWSLLLSGILALNSPPQEVTRQSRILDLRSIGYPQGDCKFPNAQLEFLDSDRLLVSFPINRSSCNGIGQREERRAAVVNVSGDVLYTLNLLPGQLVAAGPDGHILLPTEKELIILGADFSALQTLPWPEGFRFWALAVRDIYLTPSREGFVIGGGHPNYVASYFAGDPITLVTTTSGCSAVRAAADGGFACFEQDPKDHLVVHLVSGVWSPGDSFRDGRFVALPTPDNLVLLTSKFKLYAIQRGGTARELADLRWVAPGLSNIGTSYSLTSSAAHRILVSSWGCWFPLTDEAGIGYYKRNLVLDYLSGAIIYRKQSSILSDLAISPNGRFLAIRDNNRLSLIALP